MKFRFPSSFESVFANTNLSFKEMMEWLVEDFLGQIEVNLNEYRQSRGEASINQPRETIFFRIKLEPNCTIEYIEGAWKNWAWLRDLDFWFDASQTNKPAIEVFKQFFLSELALTPKDRTIQIELHHLFGFVG